MEENQNTQAESVSLEEIILCYLTTDELKQQFAQNFVNQFTDETKRKYDDDFYFDVLKPLLSSLITLKEDSAKELRYLRELIKEKQCSNEATEYSTDILETLISNVDDILLDYDVQPYRCDEQRFNPRRQNVVKKIITDNPEQAKIVAESLGEGYERKGIVLTKERVSAYATN
jgi:molecular chaperone GrpE (heat shock protein)